MAFRSPPLIGVDDGEEGMEEEKGSKFIEQSNANLLVQQMERSEIVGKGLEEEEEDDGKNTPLRYVPLCDVYSATTPCVSSASGGSKKVKPPYHHHHHRKSLNPFSGHDSLPQKPHQFLSSTVVMNNNSSNNSNAARVRPPITKFYTRRAKGKGNVQKDEKKEKKPLALDIWRNLRSRAVNLGNFKAKAVEKEGVEEEIGELIVKKRKKRKLEGKEEGKLGMDSNELINVDAQEFRATQNSKTVDRTNVDKDSFIKNKYFSNDSGKMRMRKSKGYLDNEVMKLGCLRKKKWVWSVS